MKPVVVQKYGGSSLADASKIQRVAQTVVARHREGTRVAVVVSAMGKTTDALLRQAGEVSASPSRRELDMLVTAGERISMALVSMAIHELGEDAISFTGSQSGIITESTHQGARIIEVRPHRIEDALGRGQIVIVAGYQGVSLDREVTTLGRGGSDTTAVALAAALKADTCEIYSDVDGVYSADPRVCPQAKHLPELAYETMQTMAGSGARVLNAQAVEFARRAGIVILARKTGSDNQRQTRIDAAFAPSSVRAVVGAEHMSRVLVSAPQWQGLELALAELAVRAQRVFANDGRIEAWVDRSGAASSEPHLVDRLVERFAAKGEHGGVITALGPSNSKDLDRIWRACNEAGIAISSWIAGPNEASVFVAADDVAPGVRLLHAMFVEEKR